MTISIERDIWYEPLRSILRPLVNWYNGGVLPLDGTELRAWDDVKVSLALAKRLGSSDPTYEKLTNNGAGSTGVYATAFSNVQLQEVYFDVQPPHSYTPGSDIKFHLHWAPSGTGLGNVIWGLEYTIINKGVAIGNSTIVEATVAAPGVKQEEISPIAIISGATLVESSLVQCRLYRQTTGNTYAAKAFALSADFHVAKTKPGTYVEYPT